MNDTRTPSWRILIRDLSVRYDGVAVLEGITTEIAAGCITAVIGPNGSGKTTLLRAILGQTPYQGEILFQRGDAPPQRAKPTLGYVPQRFDIDRGSPVTVADFLLMDLQRRPLWMSAKPQSRALAGKELQRVGAAHLIDKRLGVISGGEMQRVLLAKAMLRRPEILLLDEPVSGVDIAGEELFCDLLEHLHRDAHFTLVMVSHDLSVVSRHAQRVLSVNRHLICHGSVTDVVTQESIQKIYGAHMGFHEHGHGTHEHRHDKGGRHGG